MDEAWKQGVPVALQVEGLEAAVDSRDAELITLRKTLEHKEAQVCSFQAQHSAHFCTCNCFGASYTAPSPQFIHPCLHFCALILLQCL